jgi:hypothetical protein
MSLTVRKSVCLRCQNSYALDWPERQIDRQQDTKTLGDKWWCADLPDSGLSREVLVGEGSVLPNICKMRLEMLMFQEPEA